MKLTVDIALTPAQLAEAFCALVDEGQAQFFIEVAAIASKWERGPGMQWHTVGRHLSTCECATAEARDMVLDIAAALS